jgi:hypothetical protein
MNMPGFTAEMSLYKIAEHYRMVGPPASPDWGVNRGKVKPSLPHIDCIVACALVPPPWDVVCYLGCRGIPGGEPN